ncbi:B12-binding domain-containing radical SAM protein [Rhodospirillales bacterium]|nr:B12-binding domain-containing radical SAM protein [Rhodospirillales bacterium]
MPAICLVRPPTIYAANNLTTMYTPPLGVAYIAGSLKSAGFEIQVVDAVGESLDTRHLVGNDCYYYGLSFDEIVETIDPETKIIGVTFNFSFEYPESRDLAKQIRERFPNSLFVGGGEHITAVPIQSLEESVLDVGVLGEGEETMVEIANLYMENKLDLKSVNGIAYKDKNGDVVVNPRRQRKREIDEIPLPDWELIPVENYLDRGYGFGVNRGRSIPLMASRGCPYQCTFCSNPSMWTTRWIARDPDLVLDEMQFYQDRYQIENFDFFDLTAIVKKEWIISFCEKIKARGLKFTWQLPSGTRTEAIDGKVAKLLYDSGCRNMSYSPESGSLEVLKRIKKKIHPDTFINSINAAYNNGINVKCNIMVGFPGETYSELLETYRFIIRLAKAGAYDLSVWAFSPYPGSELFEQIKIQKKMVIDDKYYNSLRSYADRNATVSFSENFSNERLRKLRIIGILLFYGTSFFVRPYRPFKIIWNLLKGKQESRAEQGMVNLIRRKLMSSRKQVA